MSWPLVKLSEVAEINPRFKGTIETDTIPFVSMSDIFDEGGGFNYEVRPTEEVKKGYTHFQNKDVLVAKITPCFENGKATLVEGLPHSLGFGSTEFHVIRADAEVLDPKYVFYSVWNSRFREHASLSMKGSAGQKRLPTDYIKEFQIPLPPLSEQKRIAEILDCADAIRRTRQETLKTCDELLRSTFLEMFGDHANKSWSCMKISDLALSRKGSIRSGPFGSALKHSEFVDEGIAVLGIDNAVDNEFKWKQRRFITPQKHESLKRYKVYPNDLIITIMGTVGRIAVVPADIPEAITTKHLATITLNTELVLPEFIAHSIRFHPHVLQQLSRSSKGAIMDGLNLTVIKSLDIFVPPLEKQIKFCEFLQQIRTLKSFSREDNADSNTLFNSLVQRAFRGEL